MKSGFSINAVHHTYFIRTVRRRRKDKKVNHGFWKVVRLSFFAHDIVFVAFFQKSRESKQKLFSLSVTNVAFSYFG